MRTLLLGCFVGILAAKTGFAIDLESSSRQAEAELKRLVQRAEAAEPGERAEIVGEIEAYQKHKYLDVRVTTASALIRLTPSRASELIPPILSATRSSKSAPMYAQQVARANPDATVGPYLKILLENEERMSWHALRGLSIVIETATPQLAQAFDNGSPANRARILQVVENAYEEGVVAKAIVDQGLSDETALVRFRAAFATLAMRGDQADAAIAELAKQFPAMDESQRFATLRQLRHLREQHGKAKSLVVMALDDESANIRHSAATIAEAHDLVPFRALRDEFLPALKKGYPGSRLDAVRVWLRHLDEADVAVPTLEAFAQNDEEQVVQVFAAIGLVRLDPSRLNEFWPIFANDLDNAKYYAARQRDILKLICEVETEKQSKMTVPAVRRALLRKKQRLRGHVAVTLLMIQPDDPEMAIDALDSILRGHAKSYDRFAGWPSFKVPTRLSQRSLQTLRSTNNAHSLKLASYLWLAGGGDKAVWQASLERRAASTADKYFKQSIVELLRSGS